MQHHQTQSEKTVKTLANIPFMQCLKMGNALIVTALVLATFCVLISFVFDEYFSLPAQIAAHIGTIIFAGVLKLGYVVRCIGAHGLGHKAY